MGNKQALAGKGLFSEMVLPTISKASESLQQLKSKLNQYESYAGAAGGEFLDEDKLNQQLELLRAQQASLTSQINYYRMMSISCPENAELNMMYSNFQSQLSNYLSTTAEDIQKVQDKLKRLHEFNANVNPLFSNCLEDFNVVIASVSAIGGAVHNNAGKWLNPIQGKFIGGEWRIDSKDIYSSVQYGRAILRKWKNNPNSFIRGTILSKGGARIEDLKIFGKSIAKSESKLGKIVSKLPSYQHSTISRDLGMMKENVTAFKSMSKVGKAFKVAGWVGTAVDVTATVTGQTAGRVAGAALGQALIPIPGVGGAIGAVVGGLAGTTLGSWLGSLANKELDKGIKPKKKGWSWPW